MRKPAFCIRDNKVTDQDSSTILYCLNPKFQAFNHLLWLYNWFVSDQIKNPENGFSFEAAHVYLGRDH